MTRLKRRWQRRRRPALHRPGLRFTPYAWAKLLFFRDAGPTEVGGFGICSADDLLLVEDVRLVRQRCTQTTVLFDDTAVADYFDACVDAEMPPERFARIWIHTHPGASANPSHTDEETFARVFGSCDWAVMAILARDGESYGRIRFRAGPGGELRIPIEVTYDVGFAATNVAEWADEHRDCVCSPTSDSDARSEMPRAAGRHLAGATAELQLAGSGRSSRPEFTEVHDSDLWGFDNDDGFYFDDEPL